MYCSVDAFCQRFEPLWENELLGSRKRQRLSRLRYRIDTIFGQLVERPHLKRVWTYDLWRLTNRLARKVLIRPLAVFTTLVVGRAPRQLAARLSDHLYMR